MAARAMLLGSDSLKRFFVKNTTDGFVIRRPDRIVVTFESNWRAAKQVLLDTAKRHGHTLNEEAEAEVLAIRDNAVCMTLPRSKAQARPISAASSSFFYGAGTSHASYNAASFTATLTPAGA